MNNIEKEIINTVFKSKTLAKRIINSKDKFCPRTILDTLMYSELSITDKITFCNKLSNIRGYKTYTKRIISTFDKFKNNSYELFLLNEWTEDGHIVSSTIFKSYNDAITHIANMRDGILIHSDYYVIDLCKLNNPQNPEYSLFIRFNNNDKQPIVYFIQKYTHSSKTGETIESLFSSESISCDNGIGYMYNPGDIIYVRLANKHNYYAVLGTRGSISYLTYDDSSEFNQMLVFTPMDDKCRITQHPKYTMLYDTDDDFPKNFRYELLVKIKNHLNYNKLIQLPTSFTYSSLDRILKLNDEYSCYNIRVYSNDNNAICQIYDLLIDANESCYLCDISISQPIIDIYKSDLCVCISVTSHCMNEPDLNIIQNLLYDIKGIDKIEIDYSKDKK